MKRKNMGELTLNSKTFFARPKSKKFQNNHNKQKTHINKKGRNNL
jgi:tRNA nucleotidyltransferase (CCA-adding enzyme)